MNLYECPECGYTGISGVSGGVGPWPGDGKIRCPSSRCEYRTVMEEKGRLVLDTPLQVPFDSGAAVHRAMNGMAQHTAAEKIGVTQTCISYWRTGKRTPNLAQMVSLMEVTGATWIDVFGRADD